jgi:hypothetical protein
VTYYRCECYTLLLAAEQTEAHKKEEHLLLAAVEDDFETKNRKVTGF